MWALNCGFSEGRREGRREREQGGTEGGREEERKERKDPRSREQYLPPRTPFQVHSPLRDTSVGHSTCSFCQVHFLYRR